MESFLDANEQRFIVTSHLIRNLIIAQSNYNLIDKSIKFNEIRLNTPTKFHRLWCFCKYVESFLQAWIWSSVKCRRKAKTSALNNQKLYTYVFLSPISIRECFTTITHSVGGHWTWKVLNWLTDIPDGSNENKVHDSNNKSNSILAGRH